MIKIKSVLLDACFNLANGSDMLAFEFDRLSRRSSVSPHRLASCCEGWRGRIFETLRGFSGDLVPLGLMR